MHLRFPDRACLLFYLQILTRKSLLSVARASNPLPPGWAKCRGANYSATPPLLQIIYTEIIFNFYNIFYKETTELCESPFPNLSSNHYRLIFMYSPFILLCNAPFRMELGLGGFIDCGLKWSPEA